MSSNNDFDWNRIGDLDVGRKNLGKEVPVSIYRLMHFTVMDALKTRYGFEEAESIIKEAGLAAGAAFAHNTLDLKTEFGAFVSNLQQTLKDLKVGIVRFEFADIENLTFRLTVDEDLECSGIENYNEKICSFDEGFIAGIFKAYTGREFMVIEVDCWGTGARICRFEVKAVG